MRVFRSVAAIGIEKHTLMCGKPYGTVKVQLVAGNEHIVAHVKRERPSDCATAHRKFKHHRQISVVTGNSEIGGNCFRSHVKPLSSVVIFIVHGAHP